MRCGYNTAVVTRKIIAEEILHCDLIVNSYFRSDTTYEQQKYNLV